MAVGGQREVMLGLYAGEDPVGVYPDGGSRTGVDTRSGSGFVAKGLYSETEPPPTETGTVGVCAALLPERESERWGSGFEGFDADCGVVEGANGEAERTVDGTRGV